MNKQTNKLIPELRFPEFEKEGEWEEKVIGEVFDSYSGGTPNTSEREYYNGDIPFIRSAEINKEKTELFLSELGLKNSSAKLVDKGDLLVALYGANSGDSAISKIKGAINQAILCLKSDVSNSFTQHYLSLKKEWIVSKFVQGGQGNLSSDIVKSIPIFVPENPTEQQKIASCLSSLDEVISFQTDKLETLKTYKKGLMQNLFPQEGEKVPKLRFKEFEKDGEWIEDKLGNIGKFSKGKGISKNDIEKNGKYECLRYGELYTTYDEVIYEIVSKTNLNDNELIFSEANDVILPSSGETQIDIAKASCIIKKGVAIGGDINIFKSTLNGVFLSYYLNSAKKMEIAKLSQGISVVHLYSSQLENLIINYPISNDNSQKEQQKIADTLSSLDELIKKQADKIEQLKLHKKGLMQGLFPKLKN
jgi:type I restriction enzyme, S subunit